MTVQTEAGAAERAIARRDLIDDLQWMAEHGETAPRAAARVGKSLSGLEAWCRGNDCVDTWRALLGNAPMACRKVC